MFSNIFGKVFVLALFIIVMPVRAAMSELPQLEKAATLIQEGSLNEAIQLLRRITEAHPKNSSAHLLLGSSLSMIPQRDEAIKSLLRGLELRPDFAPGYTTAGMALSRLGEQDAALQVFERAVHLDDKAVGAHLQLALLLASKEMVDRAIDHMIKALNLEKSIPKRARLYFLLGKLYIEQNNFEKAAEQFEQSIELDDKQGETYLALGMLRKRLLNASEVYPLLEKSVSLAPRNPVALYQLALELLRLGNAAVAAEHLLRAYELRPNDQHIVYNLTRALYRAGRKKESANYRKKLTSMIQAADNARENALESARLHGEAVLLEKSKNYMRALKKYRAVLEFDPLNPVPRRNMALVLCRLNRCDEGIEELQAILRHYPDDAETARSLTLMLDQARKAKSSFPATVR